MAEQPPSRRNQRISPLWLSVIFSLLMLLVPLCAVYIAQFGDRRPDPAHLAPVQLPYSFNKTLKSHIPPMPEMQQLKAELVPEVSQDGAVFHLCEEQGKMVYKIRLTKGGDEMTVCAETGKLLAVTGPKQDDPMNLMMPTFKKS